MTEAADKTLVLYDGVCPLCNGLVRFLLRRDRRDIFRFAALQSERGQYLLKAQGKMPDSVDTVCFLSQYSLPGEAILTTSTALLNALQQLRGIRKLVSLAFVVPRPIRDFVYDIVAGARYRVFGKYEVCRIPAAKDRNKFAD